MPEPSAISELRVVASKVGVPPGCELLVFGSRVLQNSGNDLDVLLVYEPAARRNAERLRNALEASEELGLVHVTMLTVSEEAAAVFASEVGAIHVVGDELVVRNRT